MRMTSAGFPELGAHACMPAGESLSAPPPSDGLALQLVPLRPMQA